MSLVAVGLFVFLMYLAVRWLAKAASFVTGARFRAYHQLASRYRGKYENRGMTDPPTVSFSHEGSSVRVGLAPQIPGQTLGPRTRVVARFRQGIPFRLELAPIGRPTPSQPPKGTRPVRIGDAEFDRAFLVQANDPEMARDFLTAPVRWAVGNLQRLGPPGGMLLSVNPERLLVQVDRNLGTSVDGLALGVREALAIHDGLQNGVARRLGEGVAIVGSGPASVEDSGPPLCKVCGETIVAPPRVVCKACRTPHHLDCWEFIGGCSIFGCQGKTSVPG